MGSWALPYPRIAHTAEPVQARAIGQYLLPEPPSRPVPGAAAEGGQRYQSDEDQRRLPNTAKWTTSSCVASTSSSYDAMDAEDEPVSMRASPAHKANGAHRSQQGSNTR